MKKRNNSKLVRRPPRKSMPRWKINLDRYRSDELSLLTFPSDADMYAAIDLVRVGRLQGMPFKFWGDGDSLVVPKKGVPFFTKAGIAFVEKRLRA